MDSVTRCPVNKRAEDEPGCNSCRFLDTPTIIVRYRGVKTEIPSEPCGSCYRANPNVHADCWMPAVRPMSVTQIIEEVKSDICDKYCKYPEQYDDDDEMLRDVCENCALGRL